MSTRYHMHKAPNRYGRQYMLSTCAPQGVPEVITPVPVTRTAAAHFGSVPANTMVMASRWNCTATQCRHQLRLTPWIRVQAARLRGVDAMQHGVQLAAGMAGLHHINIELLCIYFKLLGLQEPLKGIAEKTQVPASALNALTWEHVVQTGFNPS